MPLCFPVEHSHCVGLRTTDPNDCRHQATRSERCDTAARHAPEPAGLRQLVMRRLQRDNRYHISRPAGWAQLLSIQSTVVVRRSGADRRCPHRARTQQRHGLHSPRSGSARLEKQVHDRSPHISAARIRVYDVHKMAWMVGNDRQGLGMQHRSYG